MEQMNFIHLKGRVGNVRTAVVAEKQVCHFSVATNAVYRNQEGQTVEEITWHSCQMWSSKKCPDLSFIKVGIGLEVKGRIKVGKYTGSDGVERTSFEVWANEVTPIPEDEPLKAENKF